jgi:hypothetical protein
MSFFGLGGGQSKSDRVGQEDCSSCLDALLDAQPAGAINPAQVSFVSKRDTLLDADGFALFQIEMAVAELDMITDVL